MKNLMKLIVLVIALTVSAGSVAQIFGVKAGLNLSNMRFKSEFDNGNDDFKMKPGFHAGLTAEIPASELFSFETGLLLSAKGGKSVEEETSVGVTEKSAIQLNLLYLDVPLTAKAYYDLGGAKIYGAFGPYAGMGLSGKSKSEYTYAGETEKGEEEIKFGPDKHLKRFDFGLTAGAGVEISSVQVGLNYSLGLVNNYQAASTNIKHRVLGISVGNLFGGK